ncbi:MAG: hypothetical protein ACLP5V_07820 [Candidatus Bathyarchaeia archaeon]
MKPVVLERPPVDVVDSVAYDALTRQEFQNMPVGKSCRLLAENLAKRAAYEKTRDEALAEQLKALASINWRQNPLLIFSFKCSTTCS